MVEGDFDYYKITFYLEKKAEPRKRGTEKALKNAEKVLRSIQQNPFIKTHEMADKTKLSQRTVDSAIAKLKQAGLLKRIGPDKGGHWEVVIPITLINCTF